MNLERLDEPFDLSDIEWRIQSSGKSKDGNVWAIVLSYVTNRAIMKRLDDVCGKAGWKNEFKSAPDSGVMCGISIKIDDEWVTKWDAAENTQVEAVKGGMSGAMKRAAVQWGIGRYLYGLSEGFAITHLDKKGSHRAKLKDGTVFTWDPPSLPEWALPSTQLSVKQQPEALEIAKEVRTLDSYLNGFCDWALKCRDPISLKSAYDSLCKILIESPELAKKANQAYQAQLSDIRQ